MTSNFKQVVRYTALVSGIFYGILHRRTLQREADAHKADQQAKQHESWVEQAKKEFAKKKEQGLSGLLTEAKDKVVNAATGSGGELSQAGD
jgi:F-type H+-transporting ATP synthase subunit e